MLRSLSHRPVISGDFQNICRFAETRETLFFFFPTAIFPLNPRELQTQSDVRFGATTFLFDGEVIGYANLYKHPTSGLSYLGNLIVDPNKRGHGAGRYLMQTMINIGFQDPNINALHLCCFNENIRGLKLYHGFGFKPFFMEFLTNPNNSQSALIHFAISRDEPNRQPSSYKRRLEVRT
jgi:ribosomal protein S18 acetylase RimI-like enzyme